ncbi:MAG: sortase domain-bontaining protein [Anaerolineales bacterium]
MNFQKVNSAYRLLRFVLPFLCAVGGMIALVAVVRSEAWAQEMERQIGQNPPPLPLQNSDADLAITKSVIPTIPVTPNSVVTFVLTVTHKGLTDTTNVRVTDTLPSILNFNGAKPGNEYNSSSGLWSVGALATGMTKTLVITATVKDGTCGQVYTNTASGLTSDLIDPNLGDNSASATLTVKNTCVVGKVIRSDNSNPIQNAKVQIKDSGNHIITYTTAADGVFTFTNSTTFPLVAGNAAFQASAIGFRPKNIMSTLQADIKNGPVVIALDPIAQLNLQKSDGTLYIIPGETITYTIPITNLGVLNATNLVISDVLDSQLTFITYTLKDKNGKIPHTATGPVNRVYTWTLSSGYFFTATETLTLAIRVKVVDPLASGTNQIDNKVFLRYNEDSTTQVNKTATDFSYTPNFEIVQNSVSPTEAKINERFTFSFRVYNRHPQVPATNVVFTNTFPSYLSFYSSSPAGSYNSSSRVFSVDLGTISAASFKDVQIIMTVNNVASSTQTLNNTATARFDHGGKRQRRSSNTVQYRILGTSTLPGTGFGPPLQTKQANYLNLRYETGLTSLALFPWGKGARFLSPSLFGSVRVNEGLLLPSPFGSVRVSEGLLHPFPLGRGVRGEGFLVMGEGASSLLDLPLAFWVALGLGILLLGSGLLGIAYSLINRTSEWASWARQIGIIVSAASLTFFGGAWWLTRAVAPPVAVLPSPALSPSAIPQVIQQEQPAFPPPEWWDAQPERLPDYAVPTPTLTADQAADEADDTPPTRLLIPKLGLDAVVKYVPFDGFSWLISGLQNEIAWMGSTSWPGLGGNTALAGHVTLRNGADGPFRYLETLRRGDEIRLYTEEALYIYRVQESLVVKDDDFSVVQPTKDSILTLITCTGWNSDLGHYLERLVVRAVLEKSQRLTGAQPGWLPGWVFWPPGDD